MIKRVAVKRAITWVAGVVLVWAGLLYLDVRGQSKLDKQNCILRAQLHAATLAKLGFSNIELEGNQLKGRLINGATETIVNPTIYATMSDCGTSCIVIARDQFRYPDYLPGGEARDFQALMLEFGRARPRGRVTIELEPYIPSEPGSDCR